MSKPGQRVGILLVSIGLCTAGWVYRREQIQQAVVLHETSVVDAALATNNQQAARQAKVMVGYLANQVCRNYNQARDSAVLSQSQQILSRTQTLTDTLRTLRQQLQTTGSSIATAELIRHLDRYSDFIQTYIPGTNYLTREFPGAPDPGWLDRVYFMQVTPQAAQATLTKLEALILRNEADALNIQAQKIGSHSMFFEWISAHAAPASETVAPGGEYKAYLFLADISPNRKTMQLTANGQNVPIDAEDGLGHVAFSVPAAAPSQPDTVRAQWHGTIRARMCPTDTVFQVDVPYFIVKPASRK